MSVEEDDSTKSVLDRVIHDAIEQIDVSARFGRKCSSEVQVMIGISEPLEWGEQDTLIWHKPLDPTDDLGQKHAVGGNGQVVSMLFDGRDGEDNGGVWGQ